MTNFVFGMLIGLFVFATFVLTGLVLLDWLYGESSVLVSPLA